MVGEVGSAKNEDGTYSRNPSLTPISILAEALPEGRMRQTSHSSKTPTRSRAVTSAPMMRMPQKVPNSAQINHNHTEMKQIPDKYKLVLGIP